MVWNAWPMTVSGMVSPERMKETVVSMAPQMPPTALSLTRGAAQQSDRGVHERRGQDDRDAHHDARSNGDLAFERGERVPQFMACEHIKPDRGLVEEQDLRVGDHPIAMLKRRCMPPESVWARWCATWSKPNWVSMAIVVFSPRR